MLTALIPWFSLARWEKKCYVLHDTFINCLLESTYYVLLLWEKPKPKLTNAKLLTVKRKFSSISKLTNFQKERVGGGVGWGVGG